MIRGRASAVVTVVAATLLTASVALVSPARADSSDDAAQQAAREIQAARDRANQAAAEYSKAQFELEDLEERAAALAAQQAQLEDEVETLRTTVEQVAVNRFVASGTSGIPLLTGYRQPAEQLQADVLVNVVTESSADAMDDYDQARDELEDNQREVADTQAELADKQEQFKHLQAAAEAEVVHLQQVEAKRLEDERIRKALEAQQAEERRQREAQEQREREAAAAAAAVAAQQAQEEAARQAQADADTAAAALAAQAAQAAEGSASAGGQAVAALAAPQNGSSGALPAAPEPEPAAEVAAALAPPPAPRSAILCPVNGSAYSDTWGAARSGGRTHQGVDMLASRGTPIYAVVSGSVEFKTNSLGGNAAWLGGSDGNRYYYAHMDHWEGSSRGVSQGDVIGYVGDTGNARGTPHLHFEVHPGGGAAVNPYPWVRDAGC